MLIVADLAEIALRRKASPLGGYPIHFFRIESGWNLARSLVVQGRCEADSHPADSARPGNRSICQVLGASVTVPLRGCRKSFCNFSWRRFPE